MGTTMKRVVVEAFGGVEQLRLVEAPLPEPGPGQVRLRLTSIGLNHADLMARKGQYKIASGDPPFTPGLEAAGVVDAAGAGVSGWRLGERAIVGPDVPRRGSGLTQGTCASHYLCPADRLFRAPDRLDDDNAGALWLTFLTAWGALVWKLGLGPGQFVALPAASSAVALAAAQVAKRRGGVTIGLTTSPQKLSRLRELPGAGFDHLVATRDVSGAPTAWHKDLKRITGDHGVDVFFDPIAAGAYLDTEIRCLAQHGTVLVYGLLGQPDKVDVTPLIRKHACIRGWALSELIGAGPGQFDPGCRHILDGFADGSYRQHVDRTFRLAEVRAAHEYMEQGRHVGKLVLRP